MDIYREVALSLPVIINWTNGKNHRTLWLHNDIYCGILITITNLFMGF